MWRREAPAFAIIAHGSHLQLGTDISAPAVVLVVVAAVLKHQPRMVCAKDS